MDNGQYLLNDIKRYVEQFLRERRACPSKDTANYMDEFENRYGALILQTIRALSIDTEKFNWKHYAYFYIREIRNIRDEIAFKTPDGPRRPNKPMNRDSRSGPRFRQTYID